MTSFKIQHSFDKRKEESRRILSKYPDRVPIIVENSTNSNINELDKHKFLVPSDLTVGQFSYVIRKRIKLEPEIAMFLFTNNILPASSDLISQIYDKYQDKDKFLYFTINGENTFGNFSK
jgi:GABA(A) receptor-associated protein